MIEFTDINKNLSDGQNMGGLIQEVYFGFHSDVLTWPTKPLNPLTLEESATLTGELVMKAGNECSVYTLPTTNLTDGRQFAASRICRSTRWFWHRKRNSSQKRYLDG